MAAKDLGEPAQLRRTLDQRITQLLLSCFATENLIDVSPGTTCSARSGGPNVNLDAVCVSDSQDNLNGAHSNGTNDVFFLSNTHSGGFIKHMLGKNRTFGRT